MRPTIDRLVPSPVFILSSMRAGSTLLRCLLDTHSQICAPRELYLTDLKVRPITRFARRSVAVAGLDNRRVEHLLWDRLLHAFLTTSGKQIIVDKTPRNALDWRRIAECWPAARYIFLLRDPRQTLASCLDVIRDQPEEEVVEMALAFLDGVDEARRELTGLEVRYERLTADPAAACQEICAYLGVEWEPSMLEYGAVDHGIDTALGDVGQRIQAGRVLPARIPEHDAPTPDYLVDRCARWGYAAQVTGRTSL
jgi:hypothetical protein